ncbi:MAG TPA: hypothetical protein VGN57_08380 [Pirellulaceae bacterium]|nr:hypothetical protein [Pirellulaceae bacterium]
MSLVELLLSRLAERIASFSPRWSPANCFAAESVFPEPTPALDRFCTVAPGEGSFDPAFDGGGPHVLVERLSIVVTPFRQSLQEPSRTQVNALGEGLLAEREALLALLLEPWDPRHEGRALLVEPLVPKKSLAPQLHRSPQGLAFRGAGIVVEAALDRGAFL